MLPNFIILGSQKAGTTSTYEVFKLHPEIFMPAKKELNYFFHQAEYAKGTKYYQNYFTAAQANAIAVGEASPGYICHPEAPRRIHRLLPEAKLIVTVRNPIARAYSQFWDNRRSLSESLSFPEVIEQALEPTYQPGRLGYFSRGTYMQYIQRYLDLFPAENLLVLPFEDLQDDPQGFYRKCFEFLGVDPDFTCPEMSQAANPAAVWDNSLYRWFFEHPHRARWLPAKLRRFTFWGKRVPYQYPPMDAESKARLVDFYQPWNQRLGEFLERNLSTWNE
ncbi:MAG: sulfotransferase [Chloroflexota bacterium]